MTVTKRAASWHPDDLHAGGLPGNFTGEQTRARFFTLQFPPTDSGEQYPPHIYLAISIDSPDYDAPVYDFYRAANPEAWAVVDEDGNEVDAVWDEPRKEVPDDHCGVMLIQRDWLDLEDDEIDDSERKYLSRNSQLASFVENAIEAGFTADVTSDSREMDGIYGFWHRVPKKQAGTSFVDKGSDREDPGLLVLKSLMDKPAAAKTSKKKASKSTKKKASKSKASTASTAATNNGSLDDTDLAEKVIEALGDETLTRKALSMAVTKLYPAPQKGAAMKRANDPAFLNEFNGVLWMFDEDEGTVTALE